jgi:ribonuclease BN (tRNA processing enzyme)
MRLTVLGKSPAWQDAGGACSGYLVEDGETSVLLDCGSGVFAKLREHGDYCGLDAVVVSHLHADHFFDLFPYAHALLLTPRQQPVPVAGHPGTDHPARPRLIAPRGARATLRAIGNSWGTATLVESAFRLEEYETTSELEIGSLRLRFATVPHYVLTHAIEVRSTGDGAGGAGGDGARLVFGADCRPNEELVTFAAGAELLLIEATLPRPERTGVRGHLTPAEAGEHARAAGVGRAVLTHISDELDSGWAREEGSRAFGTPVDVAQEGASYEI